MYEMDSPDVSLIESFINNIALSKLTIRFSQSKISVTFSICLVNVRSWFSGSLK